jgi:hypothetical protein
MIDRMDEVSESRCRRLSSSNVCLRVSGVRSSWAALATKRFCASKALSRHSSSPSTVSARFRSSSDRFDIKDRDVPEQLVLTEQRHVHIDGMPGWLPSAMQRVTQQAEAHGGPAGSCSSFITAK